MATVKPLSGQIVSRLRSGVAAPSFTQCVEELVLNSVDAGATCIAVRADIPNFKIQVVDNGCGISKQDLGIVGDRYSTSKCYTIHDLERPSKFGYRGEALASIADLSSVLEIVTKAKNSESTYTKLFSNGKPYDLFESEETRPSSGTTITVHNVFFNLPVRRKNVNPALELEHLRRSIEAVALANYDVSFSLRDDFSGTKIVQTHSTDCMVGAFCKLFGYPKSQCMKPLSKSCSQFSVHGYVGTDCHSNKQLQFIYVNGRIVLKTKLHRLVNHILNKSLLLKREFRKKAHSFNSNKLDITDLCNHSSPGNGTMAYAMFVLNIECLRTIYDITFDPSKTLVEFQDWDTLLKCVQDTLEEFLMQENLNFGVDLSGSPKKSKIDHPTGYADQQKDTGSDERKVSLQMYEYGISTMNCKNNLQSIRVKRSKLKETEIEPLSSESQFEQGTEERYEKAFTCLISSEDEPSSSQHVGGISDDLHKEVTQKDGVMVSSKVAYILESRSSKISQLKHDKAIPHSSPSYPLSHSRESGNEHPHFPENDIKTDEIIFISSESNNAFNVEDENLGDIRILVVKDRLENEGNNNSIPSKSVPTHKCGKTDGLKNLTKEDELIPELVSLSNDSCKGTSESVNAWLLSCASTIEEKEEQKECKETPITKEKLVLPIPEAQREETSSISNQENMTDEKDDPATSSYIRQRLDNIRDKCNLKKVPHHSVGLSPASFERNGDTDFVDRAYTVNSGGTERESNRSKISDPETDIVTVGGQQIIEEKVTSATPTASDSHDDRLSNLDINLRCPQSSFRARMETTAVIDSAATEINPKPILCQEGEDCTEIYPETETLISDLRSPCMEQPSSTTDTQETAQGLHDFSSSSDAPQPVLSSLQQFKKSMLSKPTPYFSCKISQTLCAFKVQDHKRTTSGKGDDGDDGTCHRSCWFPATSLLRKRKISADSSLSKKLAEIKATLPLKLQSPKDGESDSDLSDQVGDLTSGRHRSKTFLQSNNKNKQSDRKQRPTNIQKKGQNPRKTTGDAKHRTSKSTDRAKECLRHVSSRLPSDFGQAQAEWPINGKGHTDSIKRMNADREPVLLPLPQNCEDSDFEPEIVPNEGNRLVSCGEVRIERGNENSGKRGQQLVAECTLPKFPKTTNSVKNACQKREIDIQNTDHQAQGAGAYSCDNEEFNFLIRDGDELQVYTSGWNPAGDGKSSEKLCKDKVEIFSRSFIGLDHQEREEEQSGKLRKFLSTSSFINTAQDILPRRECEGLVFHQIDDIISSEVEQNKDNAYHLDERSTMLETEVELDVEKPFVLSEEEDFSFLDRHWKKDALCKNKDSMECVADLKLTSRSGNTGVNPTMQGSNSHNSTMEMEDYFHESRQDIDKSPSRLFHDYEMLLSQTGNFLYTTQSSTQPFSIFANSEVSKANCEFSEQSRHDQYTFERQSFTSWEKLDKGGETNFQTNFSASNNKCDEDGIVDMVRKRFITETQSTCARSDINTVTPLYSFHQGTNSKYPREKESSSPIINIQDNQCQQQKAVDYSPPGTTLGVPDSNQCRTSVEIAKDWTFVVRTEEGKKAHAFEETSLVEQMHKPPVIPSEVFEVVHSKSLIKRNGKMKNQSEEVESYQPTSHNEQTETMYEETLSMEGTTKVVENMITKLSEEEVTFPSEQLRSDEKEGNIVVKDGWIKVYDKSQGKMLCVNAQTGVCMEDSATDGTAGERIDDGTANQNYVEKNTKGPCQHPFLSHNATPFMPRPYSDRQTKANSSTDKDLTEDTDLQDMLSRYFESSENEATSKWRNGVPVQKDDADAVSSINELFEKWKNPMFSTAEVKVTNVQASKALARRLRAHNALHPYKFTKDMLEHVKVIGQVDEKFIACIIDTGMDQRSSADLLVLIDQHAAHERIRLEQLTADAYESNSDEEAKSCSCSKLTLKTSKVIPPLRLDLSSSQRRLTKAFEERFVKLGVGLRFCGEGGSSSIEVTSLPACLVQREASEKKRKRVSVAVELAESLIHDCLERVQDTAGVCSSLPKTITKVLNSQACHGAIKFGDPLEVGDMISLIGQLSSCDLPFQCAHGRPSIMPLLDLTYLGEKLSVQKSEKCHPNLKGLQERMMNDGVT